MTLLLAAAAFLAGIILGDRLGLPAPALLAFLLASALLGATLVGFRRGPFPAVLLAVVVLGALRAESLGSDATSSLASHIGSRPVVVRGMVAGDAESVGSAVRLRLEVDSVGTAGVWEAASGVVLVTASVPSDLTLARTRPHIRYGDRLMLEGELETIPEVEGFDYSAYLARQGIGTVMAFPSVTLLEEGAGSWSRRGLNAVRRNMSESLTEVVPEPQAAVGKALLLGIRDDLPPEMVERFRSTGTSHLLAISGLHMAVVVGIALAVSSRLVGRRGQHYLLVPLALAWAYALIAGMSPSVTRAAIMGSLYLVALAVGRPRSVLPALGLAAAVMVALDPNVLWSVSFQLSFAAMAGIAALAGPIAMGARSLVGTAEDSPGGGATVLSYALDVAGVTLAATVATLPLVGFYFQQVSLVGLPATIAIMPMVPVALVTQASAGALGLIATALGVPLGWLAWLSTSYITAAVDVFARVPGASLDIGRIPAALVWAYYGALGVWVARGPLRKSLARLPQRRGSWRSPEWAARAVPLWALFGAVFAAAFIWAAVLALPDGRLHVVFADIGQGDAALITTPGGQHILIDGGPGPLAASRLVGETLPFWDRTVELVALTHAHSDHVGGLTAALERYKVGHVVEREVEYGTVVYQAWRQAALAEGAPITQARTGQVIAFDDGVRIEVLGPPAELLEGTASDIDNASLVLRLVYGEVSFLLTGDIFSDGETWLVDSGAPLDSDVLKVAHHGSRGSSSSGFLRRVSPVAAVVSVGAENSFGHPHKDAVDRLLEHVDPARLFVTRDRGTVEFVTDGANLEVRTER